MGMFDTFRDDAYRKEDDRIQTRRSENAKVFREYVDAKTAAGEKVDPTELDRLRMSMAGGDPFMASYIPKGEALREMANQANKAANLSRMKVATETVGQKNTEREYVQKIIDANWDKSADDLAEIFGNSFGQDGVRIYGEYKPQLEAMLSESTGKKYAELSQNPAAKLVRDEDDLHRYFPAEMRNPKTASILKTMAKDNARLRNKEDFQSTIEVMGKTPDFVTSNPEMQKWWGEFAPKGAGYDNPAAMPDGGKAFETGMRGVLTQAQAAQQAKVVSLAAKDPYFDAAAKSGDEESLFVSIRSLMVQAGMPAPQSPNDPLYLETKRSLDLVSRTSAITSYNKRESDLKATALEEAAAVEKAAKSRMEAMLLAEFPLDQFGNNKSGSDLALDERITASLSMVTTDDSFFPSQENMAALTDFMKSKYSEDPENFDPSVAAGQFMAEGDTETKSEWVDRRTNDVLEKEQQIKPGTNFTSWTDTRVNTLNGIMTKAFESLNKQASTQEEYDAILQGKAVTVQALRAEITKMREVINTLNSDPAKRTNVVSYDFQKSVRALQQLENALKNIESFNPLPPQEKQMPMDIQNSAPVSQYEQFQDEGGFYGSRGLKPVSFEQPNTNTASRFDTYLDAIADIESNGDPFARAKTSTATGLFQFTKGTWDSLVNKYGEAYKVAKDDIHNPVAQRIMAGLLTMENAAQLLRQTDKEPTEKDLYLAHFLGPSRAAVVINNQGTQLLAANLFPDAARANREIFYDNGVPLTVEELYKTLGDKVKKRIKGTRVQEIQYNDNGEREV